MRVHRVDVGARLRTDHATPQGHARIPAALARTGVQNYPQPDGSVRREYRPPEEVFKADSLRTFDTATVTIGHPTMIDPSNWKEHAVGDIRNPKRDGKYVAAELVIRDDTTLKRIDSGELQELSCGYDCMLEMRPGTSPDGEKYDAIQRDITINHVGLGPKDWGRAGSEVRLRLDGGEVAYVDADARVARPARMTEEEIKALQAKADAAEAEARAAKARADAAEAKLTAHGDAARSKLEAERDEALSKAKKLEAEADPARLDAMVAERLQVLDGARLLHGKDVAPGKTIRETMVAAIVARDPEFKADDRSDDYIRARFDSKVEDAKKSLDSLGSVNRGTSPNFLDPSARADGSDAELAQLIKRFDGAPRVLKNYHRANPWLNGEAAAMAAATTSVFGV